MYFVYLVISLGFPYFNQDPDPTVDDIQPRKGLLTAGSIFTVVGKNLDLAERIIVLVGGHECHVRRYLCLDLRYIKLKNLFKFLCSFFLSDKQ